MHLKPAHYFLLTASVILVFLITGISTLKDYGMGWDEITRWNSGDVKLAYYQNLLSGESKETMNKISGDRYPGLFDLPLAAFHAAFGGNRMLQGHLLSICFGALGLISTAWLAGTIFGPQTAFLSTLLLAIFPRFYGHAMINPKDIPFLAAYTLGLAGIFWIAKRLGRKGTTSIASFIVCGLFIGLAGSSRIPGVILIGIAAGAWTVVLVGFQRQNGLDLPKVWRATAGIAVTGLFAFLVILIFFPRLQSQVFTSIPSVASSLHYSADSMPLLFNGRIMDAKDAPFAYAIQFFIISTPLWMLGLVAVGGISLIIRLVKCPEKQGSNFILETLFLGATAFPWLYITIVQPAIHDGLRHVLFAVPPLMIIMGFGIGQIWDYMESHSKALMIVAKTGLALLVLMQVLNLYYMHPYQYVSFNYLAGPKDTIPNRFDTEYWCTSSKHLLEALPMVVTEDTQHLRESGKPVKVRISGALNSARSFLPEGFVLVESFDDADYYVSNTNFRIDLIADGEVVFEIQRGGIPIGVIKRLK